MWHPRIGGADALVNLGVMSKDINRGFSISDLFLGKWLVLKTYKESECCFMNREFCLVFVSVLLTVICF